MKDWTEDSRIQRHDPIIGELQSAWKFWMPTGVVVADDIFRIAAENVNREQFEMVSKAVIVESWGQFAWEAAPYGATPGGYPYAEVRITYPVTVETDNPTRRDFVRTEDGSFIDREFYITFGLTEIYNPDGSSAEGDRWYVDMKDMDSNDGYGDVSDFVYLSKAEVTPSRILGWVRLFAEEAKKRTILPADYGNGEALKFNRC